MDLLQACKSAERKEYAPETKIGIVSVLIDNPEKHAKDAKERAARASFMAAISKFISFMDKLIASARWSSQGVVIDRDIRSQEEFQTYRESYVAARIADVASDKGLSNPKKLAQFSIPERARESALQMFALRRALEHHQEIPEKEISIAVARAGLFIDESEVTALPALIREGQKIEVRVIWEVKVFLARIEVSLTPEDAYNLIFTLQGAIVPEVYRAHMESEAKKAGASS